MDDLVQRLRECLAGEPDVLVAYLYGSQARGTRLDDLEAFAAAVERYLARD